MLALSLCSCKQKTVVNCHDLAVTVSDKALGIIDLGHYMGTCLYSGMADIVVECGQKADEEKLLGIIDGLATGEIPVVPSSNLICYRIGGQATPYLAYKGWTHLLPVVEEAAADMWANQYRTSDNLMTGNKMKDRFRDGVWIDCAFAVSTFFLYAGLSTGNQEYTDYAAFYALKLHEILHDASSGLVSQARSMDALADGETSQDCWSRGNGWFSMAMVALLRDYPAAGPYRAQIEQVAKDFYTAVLKFQDEEGLWHQELTNWDSFVETSGSGLLLAGIGQAIESGILPQENRQDFLRGLRALVGYVDPDGSVGHSCMGTLSPGNCTKEDYAIRHFYYNEVHGFGPVVLALAQAIRIGIKDFTLEGRLGERNDADRPRAYARYVPERKGDVAWENDFAAYRVYSLDVDEDSRALSGVDMWPKTVDYSIIDKWYANEQSGKSYHIDYGEGCDFYSMGPSRGIGGTGVWAEETLWTSRNYSSYTILDNDPMHAAVQLAYEPYKAGDVSICESKVIEIVPGTLCFRVTSTLVSSDGSDIVYAAGLTNFGKAAVSADAEKALLYLNENVAVPESTVRKNGYFEWENAPEISSVIFADPSKFEGFVSCGKDELVLMRVPSGSSVVFYAGAVWGEQRLQGHITLNKDYLGGYLSGLCWDKYNEIYK